MPLFIVVVIVLVLVLVAAWWFDRSRQQEGRPPFGNRRPYRPDFHGESTPYGHPNTADIEHADGAGEPPGVNRGDDRSRTR